MPLDGNPAALPRRGHSHNQSGRERDPRAKGEQVKDDAAHPVPEARQDRRHFNQRHSAPNSRRPSCSEKRTSRSPHRISQDGGAGGPHTGKIARPAATLQFARREALCNCSAHAAATSAPANRNCFRAFTSATGIRVLALGRDVSALAALDDNHSKEGTASILVVEDDSDIATAIAAHLTASRIACAPPERPRRGSEHREDPPDVMPARRRDADSGRPDDQAMAIERAGQPRIPIVLISAAIRIEKIARWVETPYYLRKPFSLVHLEAMVNATLRKDIVNRDRD